MDKYAQSSNPTMHLDHGREISRRNSLACAVKQVDPSINEPAWSDWREPCNISLKRQLNFRQTAWQTNWNWNWKMFNSVVWGISFSDNEGTLGILAQQRNTTGLAFKCLVGEWGKKAICRKFHPQDEFINDWYSQALPVKVIKGPRLLLDGMLANLPVFPSMQHRLNGFKALFD